MHTQAPPPVPVPRYEEEEEDSDEEDVYAPELPPDLAAARANANAAPTSSVPPAAAARRPIGPAARGPLQREEEEEESEDEIGPAPPPSSSSHVHEDAVVDFMQKEAQRRQAIEVRVSLVPTVWGFLFSFPSCARACICTWCTCA